MNYTHPDILEKASPSQAKYLKFYEKSRSLRDTAKHFGVNHSAVSRAIKRALNKCPHLVHIPGLDVDLNIGEGRKLGKITTQIAPGKAAPVERFWVRTDQGAADLLESMREYVDDLKESITPIRAIPPPKTTNNDLMTLYTLADFHIGMYSSQQETGEGWDIEKAKNCFARWAEESLSRSPSSGEAIFCALGDFFHYDSQKAETPRSKHMLDASGRYWEMREAARGIVVPFIEAMAKKHKKITVIFAEGNHDPFSAGWMTELLDCRFEKNPRINIDKSRDGYYSYRFGQNGIFFHHGHQTQKTNLDRVLAGKFQEIFFATKYRECHTGHLHNRDTFTTNLMEIHQHSTLSGKDAHESRAGYNSLRKAEVVTYHRDHGRYEVCIIGAL